MERIVIDVEGAAIEVDAVISERHSAQVELTKHPVESGVSPTDHARLLPQKLRLEAMVTNTPLNQVDRDFRGVSGDASSSGAPGATGYAQRVLAELDKIRTDRGLIVISTPVRVYRRMMLTSIEVPRDSKTADALRITLEFEELRIVKTDVAKLEVQNTAPPKTMPVKKVEQGKKVGETPSEPVRQGFFKIGTDFFGFTKTGDGVSR